MRTGLSASPSSSGLSAVDRNLGDQAVPDRDEQVLIVHVNPMVAASRPPQMIGSPVRDDVAILQVTARKPIPARPAIVVAVLVLADDLDNDAACDPREHILVIVVADPAITAWWRPKIWL